MARSLNWDSASTWRSQVTTLAESRNCGAIRGRSPGRLIGTYTRNGLACLCVSSEYRKHWPPGSDLTDFLSTLVRPYHVGQAYYQDHGHWPRGHERPHGPEGIIEAYQDLLAPLEAVTHPVIENFAHLLARRAHPKGHETCPCGSGKRLRNCHQSFLMNLRRMIDPEHAKTDCELLDLERGYRRRQGGRV